MAHHAVLRCVASPDPAVVGLGVDLDGSAYEFGRGSTVQSRVQDRQMSRHHFRLEPDGEHGYSIRDLGTANGTFVDGARIEGAAPFTGRVIATGATLFVVDVEPDPENLPAAPAAPEVDTRGLFGISAAARALRRSVATVAPTGGAVLLLGPTGVGKEVTAQAIHEQSGRTGPLVPVNCAAIPTDLAEAEFFGYVRGAFTGAEEDRAGYFEQASGGTLFLDEVGDLPGHLQAKLLRVLEDSVVRRVGSSELTTVDLRIVAATHVDLEASGFRRDLLARLGDWVLRIPRLADRKTDVLTLWNHFFGFTGNVPETTAEFREALVLYDWPMNVRELKRLARRITELAPPGEPVDVHMLPRAIRGPLMARLEHASAASEPPPPPRPVDDSNTPGYEVIVGALTEAKGNVKQAAISNGWHRTQLYRWLKRLRIDPSTFRNG